MRLTKAENYKANGNAHRDERNWPAAEAAYRKHLDSHGDDAAIWVQYGHSLKEQGRLDAAIDAYITATTFQPEDADPWLHLAHALKLKRRFLESMEAFQRVASIRGDSSVDADIAWVGTGLRASAPPEQFHAGSAYLVNDIFAYLKSHNTLSGIQRVQAGIAGALIVAGKDNAEFVLLDWTGVLPDNGFWQVQKNDLKAVIDYASGQTVDHQRLLQLISRAEHQATPVLVGSGTTVIVLGAFWGLGNLVERFLPVKREGARLAFYIYDIIPVTHREYCDEGLAVSFAASLDEVCLIADSVLTISDYTRETFDAYVRQKGIRPIPSATVPLAHAMTAPHSGHSWPSALLRLKGREFVTYVSTIEGRKNHAYVVSVWQQLINDGLEVPDLVFVGRKGWRVEGLADLLEGTQNLDGRVHVVQGLTDAELTSVYENSLFTVFTSFVEGWGLPVGESLMHGVPCVASNTSSIPEVGGAFVDYVDPYNIADGVTVMRRMIEDREYLASRRANIQQNFQPRNWAEVARTFAEKIQATTVRAPMDLPPLSLPEGVLFRPGELTMKSASSAPHLSNATRLFLSFYGPEPFGAWLRGPTGEILVQTTLPPGSPVVVYIEVLPASHASACSLTATLDQAPGERRREPVPVALGPHSAARRLQIRGLVADDGTIRVTLIATGVYERPEAEYRNFVVALCAIGYAAPANVAARTDLRDSLIFWGPGRTSEPA